MGSRLLLFNGIETSQFTIEMFQMISNKQYFLVLWLCSLLTVLAIPSSVNELSQPLKRFKRQYFMLGLSDVPSDRIVSGFPALPGQFPHQVLLRVFDREGKTRLCGGSVIDTAWILTAAHCVSDAVGSDIYLGSIHYVNTADSNRVQRTAEQFIVHPGYDGRTANDVALIKLNEEIEYGKNIQPIKLSASNGTVAHVNQMLVASGWGKQYDSRNEAAEQLQWTSLIAISNDACSQIYGGNIIREFVICATGSAQSSTCQGDSGIIFQIYYIRL